MSKKSFSPRIYPLDHDLTKRWYIHVPRQPKNRVGDKSYRIWVPNLLTKEDRLAEAERMINDLELIKKKIVHRKESQYNINILNQLSDCLNSNQLHLRKKSFQSYESQLRNFANYFNSLKVKKVTEETGAEFMEWLRKRGKSSTTINNHRISMKSLFKQLIKKKLIKINPFNDTVKYHASSKGSKYFKSNQIQEIKTQILIQCPEIWHCIRFIYYCFIRPGELRNIRIEDIDLDMWQIKLRSEISKNKKDQYVVIPNGLRKELETMNLEKYPPNYYLAGRDGFPAAQQIATNFLSTKHREVLRYLKYSSDYNLYSWKHTGVVQSYRAGMGLKELQLQLRHHSLDMVKIYLESMGVLDFDSLRDGIPAI